ncbi:hypothetical protein LTR78_006401 [Recurvomyces mirabilis]|uniref:Pentatricopeptide repeat protein n=1 Tax=Recurvomyces mirabilis TaxID=574656 RepID=A0AAE0WLB8_9PEZI|nr:hypothetical protein LTR78_006401 [Recurvomyces mirabilis]
MSIPNSLLRLWAARLASKIAICSAMTYDLYYMSKARGKDGSMKLAVCDDNKRRLYRSSSTANRDERSVEDVFVECLVAAGRCGQRVQRKRGMVSEGKGGVRRSGGPERVRRPMGPMFVRELSTHSRRRHTATSGALIDPKITRDEVTNLVNTYNLPSDMWDDSDLSTTQTPPQLAAPRNAKPPHPRLAPPLVIPPEKEHATRLVLDPEDPTHTQSLTHFRRLLTRTTGGISPDYFWQAYENLRPPRVRYLSNHDVRQTFRHLTWVEHKHLPGAMQRYFSFLEECLAEKVYVKQREWNTAIAFAGRWVQGTTAREVRYAIDTWMRMERDGRQADNVTFNILFDVAVKAGRFALADTIFGELRERKMVLSRYFRTSLIYYHGIRGDGGGVRQAFRDLVHQGEIVDTVVMNCVILSLIRAGEPEAAENVFARMKMLVERKLGGRSVRGWRESRVLGQLLHDTAANLRREREKHEKSFFGSASPFPFEERREKVQRITPIAPDARTYVILIRYHAYVSGDFGRIEVLMGEMRGLGFGVGGGAFVHLLRGFWLHGGLAFGKWNARALWDVWEEFLRGVEEGREEEEEEMEVERKRKRAVESASVSSVGSDSGYSSDGDSPPHEPRRHDPVLDGSDDVEQEGEDDSVPGLISEEDREPFFTKTAVRAALMAWYKCAGTRRMLEVWEEIKELWDDMPEDDRKVLEGLVERLGSEGSIYA